MKLKVKVSLGRFIGLLDRDENIKVRWSDRSTDYYVGYAFELLNERDDILTATARFVYTDDLGYTVIVVS